VGTLPSPVPPSPPPSEIAVQAVTHIDLEERGRDLPTYAMETQHFEAEDNQLHLWSITGDATFQAWQQDNGLRIGVNSEGLELDLKAHYTANVHVTQLFPAIACDITGCSAQCGWDDELPISAEVKVIAKPHWLKEWKATAGLSVEAHSDRCVLTEAHIDKTDLIEGAIRRSVEKGIDDRVKAIEDKANIHDKAKTWWDMLSVPQLVDTEHQVAVALNPRIRSAGPATAPCGRYYGRATCVRGHATGKPANAHAVS
jgi:hypothetical protein